MSELYCHYHKDRIVHDKFDKYGKFLCLECKVSENTYHDSGNPAGSGYYTHHIFCPECNIEFHKTQSSANLVLGILAIFLLLAIQIGLMATAKDRINLFVPGVCNTHSMLPN